VLRIFNGSVKELRGWPLHLGLMLIGLILILGGFIIARKKKTVKKWIVKHKFIGIFGVFFLLGGLAMAFRMVGESFDNHINSIHAIFGVISITLLIITPLIGQTIFWSVKTKRLKKKVKTFRMIHRWIGRATIILVLITITLGLFRLFSLPLEPL
jgi:hypothetical protein